MLTADEVILNPLIIIETKSIPELSAPFDIDNENDNKNIPRLINSRFSTTELNTYELVDRIGDNDTNIYD